MTTNTYGRQVVVPLTNKSGGGVIAGDVVIVDTSNNDAFTTTTSAGFTGTVGIAQETIASNAVGRVLTGGYAALVNTTASVTRGNYATTSTTVKKAVDAGSSRAAGTFVQFLTGGTTPDGMVYNADLGSAGGGSGTVTTVKDEGSNLSTAVVSLDFVGDGVTATGTTAVTVTIPAPRVVRGEIAANGTVGRGTGWTVAHTGTGHYTVTFSVAFSAAPIVVAVSNGTATNVCINVDSITTGGFVAWSQNVGVGQVDQLVDFIAMAV